MTNNIKSNWKILNKLIGKNKSKNTINELVYNNRAVTGNLDIAEAFAQNYKELYQHIDVKKINQYKNIETDVMKEITEEDVIKLFKTLPNKYTKTELDIPSFLWKKISFIISKFIVMHIKASYKNSTFPDIMKNSEIIPIFKKGDRLLPDNYRPISILPNLSKIYEKIILRMINEHIENNNILPNSQYAFRKNHSTKDAMLDLRLKLEENFNNRQKSCIIMLDLSKAFDRVSHNTLIKKLLQLRFPTNLVNLIISYLTDRKYCVKLDNYKSKLYNIQKGVPQGSILGPILYSIYVCDFNKAINQYIVQYADDTTIVVNFNSKKELSEKVTKLYKDVIDYLDEHNLTLNTDKTEIMISNETEKSIVNFGKEIKTQKTCKFLGMYVNNDLSYTENIQYLTKKLRSTLPLMYNIRNKLTFDIKKVIYFNLIYSKIIYSAPFLASNKIHTKILDKAHKKIIKILFNFKKHKQSTKVYNITGLNPIETILSKEMYKFSNKILNKSINNRILKHFKESNIRRERYIMNHTLLKFSYQNELTKHVNKSH